MLGRSSTSHGANRPISSTATPWWRSIHGRSWLKATAWWNRRSSSTTCRPLEPCGPMRASRMPTTVDESSSLWVFHFCHHHHYQWHSAVTSFLRYWWCFWMSFLMTGRVRRLLYFNSHSFLKRLFILNSFKRHCAINFFLCLTLKRTLSNCTEEQWQSRIKGLFVVCAAAAE